MFVSLVILLTLGLAGHCEVTEEEAGPPPPPPDDVPPEERIREEVVTVIDVPPEERIREEVVTVIAVPPEERIREEVVTVIAVPPEERIREEVVTVIAVPPEERIREEVVTVIAVPPEERIREEVVTVIAVPPEERIREEVVTVIAVPPEDGHIEPRIRSACSKDSKADVIFVLDISTSIGRALWHEEAKFVVGVIDEFNVGPNGVLFGALTFNRSPTLAFTLQKYYESHSEATSYLDIVYPNIQGTNTAHALWTIWNEDWFSTEIGGRLDASDVLVVVTDGFSDNPQETKKQAQLLKDRGVTIFVVGLGASNPQELAALASRPEYILKAKTANQLEKVKKDLVNLICQAGL